MKDDKEKEADFDRLAVKRMNKLIKAARLVANMGNKGNYKGSDQKKQAMVNAAQAEVNNIKTALTTGNVQADGFQF